MVDEVITIPELQESLTATSTDMAVVRQAGLDKKVSLATMKDYFITPATLSVAGVVQLNNTTNSTSTTQAATPNSVRITFNAATTAQQTANSAINQLSGKANTVHTHTAADVVSGVFATARLPVSSLSSFGITRHTSSLANPVGDSANGYVPSLPLVSTINGIVTSHTQQFATLHATGPYNRWDGGATGLNAATGRASLGAAALASPVFTGTPVAGGNVWQIGLSSGTFVRYNNSGGISRNGGAYEVITSTTSPATTLGKNLLMTGQGGGEQDLFPRINPDSTVTYRNALALRTDLDIVASSESKSGLVSEATQAEVTGGSNVSKYVPPDKLRSGFSISLTQNGWITLPSWLSGLQIRWGKYSSSKNVMTTVNFSQPFTNSCFMVVPQFAENISRGDVSLSYSAPNTTSFLSHYHRDGSGGGAVQCSYIAIGY